MSNLSSPQGVEAEHSLACPVPAQPMGQDPPCWLPHVSSAFIPALCEAPGSLAGACMDLKATTENLWQ